MTANEDHTTSTAQRLSDAAAKLAQGTPSGAEAMAKARDTANTAIGFGIMGAAKIQSRVKALFDNLPAESKAKVKDFVVKADTQVEALIVKAEEAVASAEEHLPDRAASVVRKARETGSDVRGKIRDKVLSDIDDTSAEETPEA